MLASHAAPTVSHPGAGILEALAEVQAEANHWQDQHTSLETQLAATLARVAALEHVYSPLLDRVKDLEEEIKDLKFRGKSLLKKNYSTKVEGCAGRSSANSAPRPFSPLTKITKVLTPMTRTTSRSCSLVARPGRKGWT